ncbi:Hypothetical predicted protein, partial [Paramuricea clavata]
MAHSCHMFPVRHQFSWATKMIQHAPHLCSVSIAKYAIQIIQFIDHNLMCIHYPVGDFNSIYQLQQHIDKSTRTTDSTKTLIDIIITKSDDTKTSHSGVIALGISDHDLVYICRKIGVPRENPKLNTKPFNYFTYNSDPNLAWQEWKNIFLSISDNHAPYRTRKVRNEHCPWLDNEIKKLSYHRDHLTKKALLNRRTTTINQITVNGQTITGADPGGIECSSRYALNDVRISSNGPKLCSAKVQKVLPTMAKSNTCIIVKGHMERLNILELSFNFLVFELRCMLITQEELEKP